MEELEPVEVKSESSESNTLIYWKDLPFDDYQTIKGPIKSKFKIHKLCTKSNLEDQDHRRATWEDVDNETIYKLWPKDYVRGEFFHKAYLTGFYEKWKEDLKIMPIIESDKNGSITCRGYSMKKVHVLSENEKNLKKNGKRYKDVLQDKLYPDLLSFTETSCKNDKEKKGYFYYDLHSSNLILVGEKPYLMDLDSVYPFTEYGDWRGNQPDLEKNGKEGYYKGGKHQGGDGRLIPYNSYRNKFESTYNRILKKISQASDSLTHNIK